MFLGPKLSTLANMSAEAVSRINQRIQEDCKQEEENNIRAYLDHQIIQIAQRRFK